VSVLSESPLKRILSDLAKIDGVKAVAVVSHDGFPIESVISSEGVDAEALAALVVAIHGAAQKFGEGFAFGSSEIVTAEFSNGMLFLQDVDNALLAVITDKTAVIGRVRLEMKRQRERIKASI